MRWLRQLVCSLRIAEVGVGGHGPLVDHGDWFECSHCGMRRRHRSRTGL